MSNTQLDRLSEAYGLQRSYVDVTGKTHVPSDTVKRALLQAMGVDVEDDAAVVRSLAEAPPRIAPRIAAPPGVQCYRPAWMETGQAWGVTCQLYGLRSRRNQGIGDFEDLAVLGERVAKDGGDFIGINPVHALFTAEPDRCSPFSPSNRRFLNPIYIALDTVPGVRTPPAIDNTALTRAQAATHVDYRAVATLKLGVLRALWKELGGQPGDTRARADFEAFVAAGGEALRRHAIFETLSHRMVASGRGSGWHDWPAAYQDVRSDAVARFAAENDDDVRFHLWLQWIADVQIARAHERACAAGMRIGLYLDFATGTAPDGSATWSDPELVVAGATMGAPPDGFFPGGQNWGLAPMSPVALRARNIAPLRNVLEAATRHAGAIRIDHAMGLYRLFWIPQGMGAEDGCYVLYPMADMLRAVADASVARQAVIIGEDLGTVPHGFPAAMQAAHMLSSRVLYFEWTRGGFRARASYPRNAFISASTHDLPPLAAWWHAGDVALFQSLGVIDAAEARRATRQRNADRRKLIDRLRRDLPKRLIPAAFHAGAKEAADRFTQETAVAVHAFLARTPSMLFGIQFEDLCGADMPVNVPGTWKEYPNWQLRARATVEEAPETPLWTAIVTAVARERKR